MIAYQKIAQVRLAWNRAWEDLTPGWTTDIREAVANGSMTLKSAIDGHLVSYAKLHLTAENKSGLRALRSLRARLKSWEVSPSLDSNLDGWLRAGDALIEGIFDLKDSPKKEFKKRVKATIKDVESDVKTATTFGGVGLLGVGLAAAAFFLVKGVK